MHACRHIFLLGACWGQIYQGPSSTRGVGRAAVPKPGGGVAWKSGRRLGCGRKLVQPALFGVPDSFGTPGGATSKGTGCTDSCPNFSSASATNGLPARNLCICTIVNRSIRMLVHTHVYTSGCVQTYKHPCIHTYASQHTRTEYSHSCMHRWVHGDMYACTFVHMHTKSTTAPDVRAVLTPAHTGPAVRNLSIL